MTYAELGSALAQTQLAVAPSDLHGSLVGYLCGGGRTGPRHVLDTLELESDDARVGDAAHTMVDRLYRECLQQLDDPQLGFQPLLPAESAPLAERANAVVDWCRGFLGGFGLSGAASRTLSPDAGEVLRDFGTIAASQPTFDDSDDDEDALVELVEFIRVGTLLLHAEAGAIPPGSGVH